MNWTTQIIDNRKFLICGDFKIIPCKNGRCQLREGGKLRGTFTGGDVAAKQAEFLLEQRKPALAQKAKRAPGVRKGIFGYSACSILKALGRAGVKYAQADAILKRQGIEMPKASVGVQLGFGRNEHTWQRHGKPADLTAAQMKELGVGE